MKRFAFLASAALLIGCGGSSAPTPAVEATPMAAPAPDADEADDPMPKGDAAAGEAVYKNNCMACHLANGTGMNGALAADFVNDPSVLAKTDAQLYAAVSEGVEGTTMAAWEDMLDDQQRADAVAYIRATFGKK